MCRHGLRLHKGVKQSKAVHITAKICLFFFCLYPFNQGSTGQPNLWAGSWRNSFLHLNLAELLEEKTQGRPSCLWISGVTYCHQFDCTLQRLLFILTLRKVSTTTPGMRTLLLSTSSLARTLWWVRKYVSETIMWKCSRNGEEHQDGSCGFHCLPRRPLWSLSWLQHHLIHGDHLLGFQWTLQSHF